MKDIRPALRALMLSDPAIAAMVTTGGVARIYPAILPQGVSAPSIVQNLITESSDYHNTGPSGLGVARVQLDAWALTADDSVILGNMVHDKLSGFAGTVVYGSNSPASSVLFKAIFGDQGRDDYDPTPKLYSRRRDYLVWYSET